MPNQVSTFFDAIIECLKTEQAKSPRTPISPELWEQLYADIPTPAPPSRPAVTAPAPLPVQSTAPVARPAAPPRMAESARTIEPAPSFEDSDPIPPRLFRHQEAAQLEPCPVSDLSLDELRILCLNCRNCELCAKRTNVVFGEGNPNADLMFIGEGPGMDEDHQGRPFVGAAGQLLTKMINAMQFSREEVYIANIVKCRPPNNRVPLPQEAGACLPYLRRQIELVNPQVIVLLGATPLQHLLGLTGIMRNRGKWSEYNGIRVMPTFHPAYLLRNPSAKRDVWNDLQAVMQLFGKAHHSR